MNTKLKIMKTPFLKITITGLILIMAILVNTSLVNAQQDNLRYNQQDNNSVAQSNQLVAQDNKLDLQHKQHGDQHEKMEAQRVAFITQALNLTPDEAKVFWPVYNEYDAKRHELKKSFKGSGDLHTADIEKLTEKEASQILDNQIIESQKFLDLRKEYHAKFKSVLPAVKVLKLYDAEREFQKMLMEKMRHDSPQVPINKK
jgi:hypothetical protein